VSYISHLNNNMIITYLRSSSYTTWDFCQHKYFLDYTLGFHSPANKSAQKGSIVHKALELLAKLKLALQQGKEGFSDSELESDFCVDKLTPDTAIEYAYKHYANKEEFEYEKKDFADCRKWMWEALLWKNGMFSPLKMDIVSPEQFFDFEIREPWAEFSYKLPGGEKLEGYLSLKGTLDLVVQRKPNVYEIIDWKTGRRWDWNKEKSKEYEDFFNDPQLLMYHYAACRVYPKIDNIFVSIFWLQSGSPFSICLQRSDLGRTTDMLKKRFMAIKNTYKPQAIFPHYKCKWCHFSKNSFEGPVDNYQESICKQTRDEVHQLGIDKVTAFRAKAGAFHAYAEGGGRRHDK
jgi:ATP-dependent helicase/DNAse subunit B